MAIPNIFTSAPLPPHDRATSTYHRQIDLQSPADLAYLQTKLSATARRKIDTHLPPTNALSESATGEDPLRKRVEVLVDEYLGRVWEGAGGNVRINGMSVGECEGVLRGGEQGGEIEAFDNKLAQGVQALSAQIESHTLALANLRRNAPGETAERYRVSFEKAREEDEKRVAELSAKALKDARERKLEVGEVERLEEVKGTWERGTEELGELRGRLGGTVEKMERAREVGEYVEGR
ncbi:hypothetical protein LTR95_003811 [Oleoguttula sp. CCFEE 5521]